MGNTNILEEVTRTSIQLILKEPFFGHFFSTLVREVSDVIPTMGVAVGGEELVKLYVNERFWKETLVNDEFRYGVLKHEILHIVFKHILRVEDFANQEIANMAMDIVVNQYIERKQLPGNPILLEDFTSPEFPPNESVDFYYTNLLHVFHDNTGKENPSASYKTMLSHLASQRNKDSSMTIGDHTQWGNISEAERKIIDSGITEAIENTLERIKSTTNLSDLPAGLKDYFNQLGQVQKPVLDWRRVLRLFSNTSTKTYIKNTIKRVSKRYGSVPGIKIKRKNKLLVALDTSGSTSEHDHVRFFNEVNHIHRQGAEIMIVECDTRIQKQYLYRGQMPEYLSGRGGTSFEAPLKYANEEYFPDAIIYFTDGYSVPPKTISRMPLLWIITPNGVEEDTRGWNILPGRKVKMNIVGN
jgi:predicted metal-dependent peptidase